MEKGHLLLPLWKVVIFVHCVYIYTDPNNSMSDSLNLAKFCFTDITIFCHYLVNATLQSFRLLWTENTEVCLSMGKSLYLLLLAIMGAEIVLYVLSFLAGCSLNHFLFHLFGKHYLHDLSLVFMCFVIIYFSLLYFVTISLIGW